MKKNKTWISLACLLLLSPFLSYSQVNDRPLTSLLAKYFIIKTALVSGDGGEAMKAAADFVSSIKAADVKSLTATEQKTFNSVQARLLSDANTIAAAKDLSKQRAAFQSFSESMVNLVKSSKPEAPVYVAYCPMKKAWWLSPEKVIKNPYYGSTMLNCGQVKESIQ